MSEYKVMLRRRQSGYKVEVVGTYGSRHTILGFDTEADATAWVEADRKREQIFSPTLLDAAD